LVDGSGDPTFLEGGRRPVLGFGGAVPEVARVNFTAGLILVAYTDGLVEQRRVDDRGLQLLSESVQSARGRSARSISDAVGKSIVVKLPTTSLTQ
jgi:serine phosphatase RsbU (regulator of sigma subunit)